MTKNHKTRRNNSTGLIFDYTLDTFETFYFYAWVAMLASVALSVVLYLVAVYVL